MIKLFRRLITKPKRLEKLNVTIFSREACTCCDKALDVLEPYRERHGFRIEIIDIDQDPALVQAYGLEVPVVAFDGKVRFKGVVNQVLLERLLENEPETRN
jgi:predicted thioredoxin/glutaredoxin